MIAIRKGTSVPFLVAGLVMPAFATGPAQGELPPFSPPGVYGRVDLSASPKPELLSRTPVIADERDSNKRADSTAEPIYLWVPAGHRSHWREYCERYGACRVPVHFVRGEWYHHHGRGKLLSGGLDEHDHEH